MKRVTERYENVHRHEMVTDRYGDGHTHIRVSQLPQGIPIKPTFFSVVRFMPRNVYVKYQVIWCIFRGRTLTPKFPYIWRFDAFSFILLFLCFSNSKSSFFLQCWFGWRDKELIDFVHKTANRWKGWAAFSVIVLISVTKLYCLSHAHNWAGEGYGVHFFGLFLQSSCFLNQWCSYVYKTSRKNFGPIG